MKKLLIAIGCALALTTGGGSVLADKIINIEMSNFCTLEKCKNLSSVRAYNRKYCFSKPECLTWLEQNNICDGAALQRCKSRERLGAEKVPDIRSDGMDF